MGEALLEPAFATAVVDREQCLGDLTSNMAVDKSVASVLDAGEFRRGEEIVEPLT